MTVYEDALKLHELHHGKLSIEPKVPCETPEDLTLAYTPGVAQPCLEINKDPENAYRYTGKGNTVAVVTDGTAVLGLGDIGAVAGLPVMEGKALLMHRFAGLDAFPDVYKRQGQQPVSLPEHFPRRIGRESDPDYRGRQNCGRSGDRRSDSGGRADGRIHHSIAV